MVPRSQVPHVCLRSPGFIILEGTMEHTCPLESPGTIYHSGKTRVGVELAMEVVMGKKAIGSGRRAGCALAMRGKEKLMESDEKPESNSAGHPERESSGGQASCSGTALALKARMVVARWASGWGRGTHTPPSSAHPSSWENKAGLRDHFLTDSVARCPRMKMCCNALSRSGKKRWDLGRWFDTDRVGFRGLSAGPAAAFSFLCLLSRAATGGCARGGWGGCSYITARRVLLARALLSRGAGEAGTGMEPQRVPRSRSRPGGESSASRRGRRARKAAGEVKVSGCEAPDPHPLLPCPLLPFLSVPL